MVARILYKIVLYLLFAAFFFAAFPSFFYRVVYINAATVPFRPCDEVFNAITEVTNYCKNSAPCNAIEDSLRLWTIKCDCNAIRTDTTFFAMPDCSAEFPLPNYDTSNNIHVVNTTWLENLLAINEWKDTFSRVSRFCISVPCPSPDGSSSSA